MPRKQIGYVPLCTNCRKSGHLAEKCSQTPLATPKVRYVSTRTNVNTDAKICVNFVTLEEFTYDVNMITNEVESWPSDDEVYRVGTRSSTKDQRNQKEKNKEEREDFSEEDVESDSKICCLLIKSSYGYYGNG